MAEGLVKERTDRHNGKNMKGAILAFAWGDRETMKILSCQLVSQLKFTPRTFQIQAYIIITMQPTSSQ
jgi:hypothetical protein